MSGVLVKLISLMLLFPRWGLPAVQPLTSCYSFATATVQLLKFNSICHLRRGPGKSHHHKKNFFKSGSSKEQKKNNPFPNTSLEDRVKNVSFGPSASLRKGGEGLKKYTCTYTLSFRFSWKNEVRFRRPGSKENRLLKLLWGTLSSALRAD